MKNYKFSLDMSLKHLMLTFMLIFITACSGGGGDGDNSGSCDIIANPDGPAFFRVENNLSTGLEWILPAFAFGADMQPGECTIMGVTSRQFTVDLQQCNIGNDGCTSNFGLSKSIVFSVLDGDTFTLTIDSNFFN